MTTDLDRQLFLSVNELDEKDGKKLALLSS
jgi:hypothetical protein